MRHRLLPCCFLLGGCFSEASDVAGTDAVSATDSAGPSSTGSLFGTSGPSSDTMGPSLEGGDTRTSGDDGAASSDHGESDVSDTGTVAGSTDTDDGPPGAQPYGAPCESHDDCESGICVLEDPFLPGVCAVNCDPTEGACAAIGHAAFCIKLYTSEFVCTGVLETGDDLEDGLLLVGEALSGSLVGDDRDAFYLENPLPEHYTVRVYPGAGLDVMITMYDQADYGGFRNEAGVGGIEEIGYTMADDGLSYPRYPVAVISAVGGTSGTFEIRLEHP